MYELSAGGEQVAIRWTLEWTLDIFGFKKPPSENCGGVLVVVGATLIT